MPSSAILGARLESVVKALISEGRYGSRSEVLREGVRLVEEREKRLATLNTSLSRGLADAAAGRSKPLEEVAARLTAKYQAKAKARSE